MLLNKVSSLSLATWLDLMVLRHRFSPNADISDPNRNDVSAFFHFCYCFARWNQNLGITNDLFNQSS